jgi:hypothetical protein
VQDTWCLHLESTADCRLKKQALMLCARATMPPYTPCKTAAVSKGKRATPRSKREVPTDPSAGDQCESGLPSDSEPVAPTANLASTVDLRNAMTADAQESDGAPSDLGETIGAFAELVAVMRATGGGLVDIDVLNALIAWLAELLDEARPPTDV